MDMENARFNMIEQQIHPWNVSDKALLDLLFSIKREAFVPSKFKHMALSDLEIPLPGGQKMLLPSIEIKLIQELKVQKTDKVLEIGAGSGYVTALLAKLAEFVYTLEINEQNKQLALKNLAHAGVNNVSVISGNGIDGLASKGKFDKIFIGGGVVTIPEVLKNQLNIQGKLVGFSGTKPVMHAVLIEKISQNEYSERKLFETDVEYLINASVPKFKF